MQKYFSASIYDEYFMPFSPPHLITLVILAIITALLISWFRKSDNTKALNNYAKGMAIFMLINEILYNIWCIATGEWSLDYSLPLHLCTMCTFLCIIMLFRNSYRCFEIAYFWGLGGGLQALLTPELSYPFPHYRYFCFFLGHAAILISIFYMVFAKKFTPTIKSILRMFAFTNIYMIIVSVINYITGGNYMFICSKPENASIMDFLGPWPWYILSLEAVGLVICLICYLPFIFKRIIKLRIVFF